MTPSGVVVEGVWKKFNRGELHDSLRDLIPALAKHLVRRKKRPPALGKDDFWALSDVTFHVEPGTALGIIGPNGAGKSTLLKILNRILRPNLGSVRLTGRVGALIELAAGFHPDLTGTENVYLQGSIMGMRRREIGRKFDEIVSFAGLSEFMDMPVKRYSSGMNARLGFAIAAHLDVDALLIDEVLSVGDFDFQQKAFAKLREVTRSGIPVVVVSHQLDRISDLCSHAILLRRGRIEERGTPAECIDAYVSRRGDAPDANRADLAVEITDMEIAPSHSLVSGERVEMIIHVTQREDAPSERLAVWVQARSLQTGELVFAASTDSVGADVPEGDFRVRVSLQMNVPAGSYSVEGFLWDQVFMKQLHVGPPRLIQVVGGSAFMGSVQMNAEAAILSPAPSADRGPG